MAIVNLQLVQNYQLQHMVLTAIRQPYTRECIIAKKPELGRLILSNLSWLICLNDYGELVEKQTPDLILFTNQSKIMVQNYPLPHSTIDFYVDEWTTC